MLVLHTFGFCFDINSKQHFTQILISEDGINARKMTQNPLKVRSLASIFALRQKALVCFLLLFFLISCKCEYKCTFYFNFLVYWCLTLPPRPRSVTAFYNNTFNDDGYDCFFFFWFASSSTHHHAANSRQCFAIARMARTERSRGGDKWRVNHCQVIGDGDLIDSCHISVPSGITPLLHWPDRETEARDRSDD